MAIETLNTTEWILRAVAHGFETPPEKLYQLRARWVPYFQHCHRVLDIGCGEGVLLQLLQEAGIPAVGVELDAERVATVQAKGFQVERMLAQEYLVDKHNEFDGIFMGHILEHFDGEEGVRLLYDCRKALRPRGTLIILTPYFEHPDVASRIFWLDD